MTLRNDDQVREDDQFLTDYLEVARQKFEEGNKAVVWMALQHCMLMNRPVPDWLREAYLAAYQRVMAFEIRSLDEEFGPAGEKGAHLDKRKEFAKLRYDIAVLVALRPLGQAIDRGLFEGIGLKLEISGRAAEDIYYKFGGKELLEMIEPLLRSNTYKTEIT